MNVSAPDETDMTLEDLKVRLGHAEPAEIVDSMSECAVETCRRPGVICVDRNVPPKWVLCRVCWLSLQGFGPYVVRPVWGGPEIMRFIALQPHAEPEDDRGPILEA